MSHLSTRMTSLGDKAEEVLATKKAEEIKANNSDFTVVEEEGQERYQCDNCNFKSEKVISSRKHITAKHVSVCKYNKFGYCKFREGCTRLHHTKHVKTGHPVKTLEAAITDTPRLANYLN